MKENNIKASNLALIGMILLMLVFFVGCGFNGVETDGNSSESSEMESTGDLTESESSETSQEPEIPPVISGTDFGVANPSGVLTPTGSKDIMHAPSVEYDPESKQWYVWGSYAEIVKSSDLIVWNETFDPGLFETKIVDAFEPSEAWALRGGDENFYLISHILSPDVIYNKDLGKWCLYMSVKGDNHYASIAMATADSMGGPYTYQGTVVYSGFVNSEDVSLTDYEKATGTTDVSRYVKKGWDYYGANAVDPCVLYDENEELWMVYGSWSGGIFMLKLDNATGLRDYSYIYELDEDASDNTASDPYLGIRVSGGYGGTGDGAYIVWDETAGFYYLYVSYGGENSKKTPSGYQMRLFRSKDITGPYVDAQGNVAICRNSKDNQSVKGIKIMGNYHFESLWTAAFGGSIPASGYRSPGHNSALVDNVGNHYIIYQTCFDNSHVDELSKIRIHQQFINEDGWPVTAPYEYLGSKIEEGGYPEAHIVGSYELVNHGNELVYDEVAPMLSTLVVNLNADHTITGDLEGTWSQKDGSCYATIVIDGTTYKGVFFRQYNESSIYNQYKNVMTFSVIGPNNIALWGSRIGGVLPKKSGTQQAAYTFDDASNLGSDVIGTVGNATIYGCAPYKDNVRGNVLAFDGKDDYVKLSESATQYSNYTIMLWFKSTSEESNQRLLNYGQDGYSDLYVSIHNEDAGMRMAILHYGGGKKQANSTSPSLNQWNHMAITINEYSTIAIQYINGVRVGEIETSVLLMHYPMLEAFLGKSRSDDSYFKGYMDDVMIFDYVLSPEEIKEKAGL